MKKKLDLLIFPRIGAFLLMVLGLVLLLWPEAVIGIFPPLIGLILMVVGVHGIISSTVLAGKHMEPGLKLVQSIVCFVVGLVFLLKQDVSSAFLTILFGLFVLVNSAVNLSDAIGGKLKRRELLAGIGESFFGFVWGALLLFDPFSGQAWWARFLGAYFVFYAIQALAHIRAMRKNLDRMMEEAEKHSDENENL